VGWARPCDATLTGLSIGINALYLIPGRVGGTEIYLRSLLGAIAEIDPVNQYVVFTNRETDQDLVPRQANFLAVPQPVRAAFRPLRILWEQTGLVPAARRRRLDVLFNPGFTSPILAPCPTVTVFHDLQHKRYPQYFRKLDLPFWRFLLWASARRSTTLLAVSETTAQDLARYYRLRPEKIRVIEHGVDPRFFDIRRRRQGITPQPYLLCVSTLHAHKNLDRLVRAFAQFRRSRPDYRLVLAGMRGFHARALEELVVELGLTEAVWLTGWIPREDLYGLFLHASAFLYPSSFEGFGMPVLEALAAGLPTACSAIEPLKQLAGPAALQFNPQDQGAILDAMTRLTSDQDLRQRLAEAGPARAAEFSWRNAAQKTLEALQDAAGHRSRSSS
jgi:glycosyltransferase involved in cell wall biosynthesis